MRATHVVELPAETDANENRYANIFARAFPEYDITWEIVPAVSDYDQKKNLAIASGNAPDLIQCSKTDMVLWADQGLIQPLDALIEQYAPDYRRNVAANGADLYGRYLGRQYSLITPSNPMLNGRHQFVRKDWLDRLGLEMPRTTEELFTVLKAFTFDDPDGNGKNDTYGMSGVKNLAFMDQLTSPFDVDFDSWSRVDGQIVPDIIRPETKEALAYIKKCWEAGVIEPDAFILQFGEYWARCRQGYYGFINMYQSGVITIANPLLRKDNPQALYAIVAPPIEGPGGTRRLSVDSWDYWHWAVPVAVKHPEAGVRLFNYSFTEEADRLFWGDEGVSHEIRAGYYFRIPRQKNPQAWAYSYNFVVDLYHTRSVHFLIEMWTALARTGVVSMDYVESIGLLEEYGDHDPYRIPSLLEAEKMPVLRNYFTEMAVNIVLGRRPLDDFDGWRAYFYTNGGTEIIEDVNRLNN